MSALVERLSTLLLSGGLKMTAAESCTGGLLAAAMTERPGSSAVFERGFVTYSNEAKIELLGVDPEIIAKNGAVSLECAEAMAQGALQNSHADIALSITGIAGPDGGSEEKPVGTVCFGVATKGGGRSFSRLFAGERHAVRESATQTALEELISTLEGAG